MEQYLLDTSFCRINSTGLCGIQNTINLHLYHYGCNNPLRFSDLDGQLSIEYNTTGDLLSMLKPFEQATLVPLGGGYTDLQTDLRQLRSLIEAGISGMPGEWAGLGPWPSRFSSTYSALKAANTGEIGNLAQWGLKHFLSKTSDLVGPLFALFDFAGAISQRPELLASNYTKSPEDLAKLIFIEQLFLQDILQALDNAGFIATANYYAGEGGMIANVSVLVSIFPPEDKEHLMSIIQNVKASQAIYEEIELR
jgi:hypothetical protein